MKKQSTIFFSAAGVAALFLVLIAVNYLNSFVKARLDLTADRAFTLSEGTRNVLKKLDSPVQIRLYVTRDDAQMPVPLKTYAGRVEDLLNEYHQASKGLVEIQRLDPQPDSDAEDSARLDGVEPQSLSLTDRFYLGISVSMADQKQVIPFLDPNRERQLEYDLTRAISSVMTETKPVIGVMSPLPVAGMMSPMMMMGGGANQPAWVFYNELQRAFEVREIEMSAGTIPEDIKVLVLIHPKGISKEAEFALDQFVLRGGKLVAFLDPICIIDSPSQSSFGAPPSSSTLPTLLPAWGVAFNTAQVVADATLGSQSRRGPEPTWLSFTRANFSQDDIVTADADNALFISAGAFEGAGVPHLTRTPLVKTTTTSQTVEAFLAQMGGTDILNKFKPSGLEYAAAIRLTGTFKTAFPDGKPKSNPEPENPDNPQKKEPEGGTLKEGTAENTVILFADADFIQDPVAVQELQNPFGGGQRLVMPANGNLNLAQSAVEQLSGDDNLIKLRSRSVRERPFTVVRAMEEKARAAYRSKIEELEQSLQEAQSKINELQRQKDPTQKFILSPEQEKELESFRKKESDAKKELKELRRDLRKEIVSLEERLKWFNIAFVPALVTIAGIALGVARKRRAAAR